MNGDTWWRKYKKLNSPCANCGDVVFLGSNYDWIPELGGEFTNDEVRCLTCGSAWLSDEAPKNFFTRNGEYWNVEGIDQILKEIEEK